ncbi:MAG: hypothetical protein IT385_08735 [Deltaproteobacteria bacterium]|nr:hypothetical protein [Deltaproteobacteria bacterium]
MARRRPVSSRPDPRRFAALRLATLARTPGFLGGARAAGQLAAMWARGERLGLEHHHRDDLQALWFHDPETWFGGPATLLFLDRDPRSDEALTRLLAIVRAHLDALDETTWLEVDARDLPLVHGLVTLGFHLESVVQVGDPRVALDALLARHAPAAALAGSPASPGLVARLDPLGLELAPAGPGDVDAIIALHREAFTAQPEYCFFGALPGHLTRMRAHILSLVARPGAPPEHWIVREAGTGVGGVVGHLETEIEEDHPFWGCHAGLGFVLVPHLRGRGIVKTLYHVALAAAIARGARLVKGGSAQPAVLGLGRLMRRPWHTIALRRVPAFDPEHFLRFHPERQDY